MFYWAKVLSQEASPTVTYRGQSIHPTEFFVSKGIADRPPSILRQLLRFQKNAAAIEYYRIFVPFSQHNSTRRLLWDHLSFHNLPGKSKPFHLQLHSGLPMGSSLSPTRLFCFSNLGFEWLGPSRVAKCHGISAWHRLTIIGEETINKTCACDSGRPLHLAAAHGTGRVGKRPCPFAGCWTSIVGWYRGRAFTCNVTLIHPINPQRVTSAASVCEPVLGRISVLGVKLRKTQIYLSRAFVQPNLPTMLWRPRTKLRMVGTVGFKTFVEMTRRLRKTISIEDKRFKLLDKKCNLVHVMCAWVLPVQYLGYKHSQVC